MVGGYMNNSFLSGIHKKTDNNHRNNRDASLNATQLHTELMFSTEEDGQIMRNNQN